ncbi:hypothetical protein [Paenibacillus herberti]|uniref:Uncharacterized protein n=1 Tax=Paenibacillus herberti TaxID=1619309 RepID=A0A229NX68_9BACL|nr:hypothetical protein [Paenibacillus herberti]OXM14417.1 hypothetical protein CGZ75_15850 [Paenibacillus herberti]
MGKQASIGSKQAQTWSTEVEWGQFDSGWTFTGQYSRFLRVVANRNNASVVVTLGNGQRKRTFFNKGGTVLLGVKGISIYSKPHRTVALG